LSIAVCTVRIVKPEPDREDWVPMSPFDEDEGENLAEIGGQAIRHVLWLLEPRS
jgi:hypothetical protein